MYNLQTHIGFTNLWSNKPRFCVISSQRVKNGTRTPCIHILVYLPSDKVFLRILSSLFNEHHSLFNLVFPFSNMVASTENVYFFNVVIFQCAISTREKSYVISKQVFSYCKLVSWTRISMKITLQFSKRFFYSCVWFLPKRPSNKRKL